MGGYCLPSRDELELWDFVKALEAYYNTHLDEAQDSGGGSVAPRPGGPLAV